MNIKEYYTFMSRIYLNQVILAGVFLTICLLFLHTIGTFVLFKVIICLLISVLLYFFSRYLFFSKKEEVISSQTFETRKMVSNTNQLMMLFFPAPSLRIKFFNSNGICEWELCDEKVKIRKWFLPSVFQKGSTQSYELKKRDGLRLAILKLNKRKQQFEIITNEQKHLLLLIKGKKRNVLNFDIMNQHYVIVKSIHTIDIKKNGVKIATINKGWMPINWQKSFSPNTPILTFQECVSNDDRYIIYCLLILLFANQYN
jgi:hypothetical protein